jgi:hypothetical protein
VRLFLPLTIAGALLMSACYEQPVISPQRALRCNPVEEKGQCPKGFTCSVIGLCAPNSCSKNADCPGGLVCTGRGCVPQPDAGPEAIQIPVLPDGAQLPDVAVIDDAPPQQFDAPIMNPDGGQD